VKDFVSPDSIVRRIWGRADTILFIFAGASAEFALNKAVDWLYFTGKLPSDPIGRLFSTVQYARRIVFASHENALKAIDTIAAIHTAVEQSRQSKIPDWAYRDVLYMLIHYSIASYELLVQKMNDDEKAEVYDVFFRVGDRMGLQSLPATYVDWLADRQRHLHNDLQQSRYSADLFHQYKKHLGSWRFRILVEAQKMVVPSYVHQQLQFQRVKWLMPTVPLYKIARRLHIDNFIMNLLLPAAYKQQVFDLNSVPR
jgi:uncharacterized protein (DUF2236 family)